jgi:hypothetical protein
MRDLLKWTNAHDAKARKQQEKAKEKKKSNHL